MGTLSFISILNCLLFLFFKVSFAAVDSITPSQSINDGSTLVSKEGSFELGFFSPGSSKNRYLGIWYKNIPVQTVVWVANRLNPINDSSGLLMINRTSSLVLMSNNKSVVWSTGLGTQIQANNPVLQLLDSGNLVLKDGNSGISLWESFDYPSDTLLPGMKMGWDLRKGIKRRFTAWRSPDDPSPGDFTYGIEMQPHSYPEAYIRKGNKKFYRTGPWNGLRYSGSPELKPNPLYAFDFVSNDDEVYYIYNLVNNSLITRIVLNQTSSSRERYTWIEAENVWRLYSSVPRDYCDNYGLCGANGNCILSGSPVCQCLEGFEPKSQEKWSLMDWSQGCVRNKPLSCHKDGFVKFNELKLPDTTNSWANKSMSLKECRDKCLNNCSCMAYTNSDIRGEGSGCALWFGDLVDVRQFPAGGQELYIRMSASEIEAKKGRRMKRAVIVAVSLAVVSGMLLIIGFYICRSRTKLRERNEVVGHQNNKGQNEDLELPLLDLSTIASATDNFEINNKLGEGGFGPVYKGILKDGQEIAVKRLSTSSGQGLNEFKNEVRLIAKLQHRNLVKLLACCIQEEEKILVYEYMPNKSLDSFIFDQTKSKMLDWSKRFHIICGIARGLQYLHQDSRLRIIHRDLKASNVLLDCEMNPKISDFGMARTFGGDQLEGNTNRVVGTYGYMAPEYAFDGQFSTKSDVFSFGILLLEIISGKKSRGFYDPNYSHNLIGIAWILWNEGRPLDLIDECLGETCTLSEVLRCIHLSLLCVQQRPEDRPSMSSVVVGLGSESAFAQPKKPGFFLEKDSNVAHGFSSKHESSSTNEVTITILEAR
ncbi:G-type lectin S-receptor-like serine/threonine-protein kinase At4g27290 isoform X1 [Quercus robur]|uniref:G-type lectin S-receptor-like serine/threonine-protein kinase At4g27290 isoform X1 n=1 Tax=Quercus robur TaxID=38942 RepID=UPI0021613D55|nr:G-type lectin S-receptor-like serine/threonine-protein kinase At4g27290 isoform X1 [Quercus robur]